MPTISPEPPPGASRPSMRSDASGQVRRLVLGDGQRQVIARCREFILRSLGDWGRLPTEDPDREAAAEDAVLLLSELVTNACLHAGGPQQVVLWHEPDCVRIEVYDASPLQPAPRIPHRPGYPGGHGLFLIQRLSRTWGVTNYDSNKAVWVEVALSPAR